MAKTLEENIAYLETIRDNQTVNTITDSIKQLSTSSGGGGGVDAGTVDTKITENNTDYVDPKLDLKLDITTYTTDKKTFALKTELDAKLDTSTYTTDKATFALKTELTPLAPKSGKYKDTTTDVDLEATCQNLEIRLASLEATREAMKIEASTKAQMEEIKFQEMEKRILDSVLKSITK